MQPKTFNFDESNVLTIIDKDKNVWFKGFDIASILGYKDKDYAIRTHVDEEDKKNRSQFDNSSKFLGSKGNEKSCFPTPCKSQGLKGNEKNQIFINESGLYSLIMRSKLDKAKAFKRWVTSEVLPTLRKTGEYTVPKINHRTSKRKTFKIGCEADLHKKVVSFMKNRFPDSLFVASLGENQDTDQKRINSHCMGYLKGTPDIIINNLHKHHSGFAIEFKTPTGRGQLSTEQNTLLQVYKNNGFKTLVSNDYDEIIEQLLDYYKQVRIKCKYCARKFLSSTSLEKHHTQFHRITV
jgi:prophage antirepressor-like protein